MHYMIIWIANCRNICSQNKVLEGKIEIGLKPLSKIESVNEFVNEFICAGYGFKSCILDNSIDELNDLQEGEI